MSRLGHPRVHLRETDSTNERARALALAGAPHGALVTTAAQSAGRGRQGRTWSAPAGSSVLMSLVLRDPPRLLPLMAAVAVCDVAGPQARIKWPNDVVLEQRPPNSHAPGPLAKLAGILVEGRLQERWAVLGIGLNVAVRVEDLPAELRGASATLGLPREEVEPMLERLLVALERRIGADDSATLAAWRERDALLGREIAWDERLRARGGGSGTARGIDGEGRLVVELAGGARTELGAGEVHLLKGR